LRRVAYSEWGIRDDAVAIKARMNELLSQMPNDPDLAIEVILGEIRERAKAINKDH
jgi:hypothetical protein